jgi:hypothetical protein
MNKSRVSCEAALAPVLVVAGVPDLALADARAERHLQAAGGSLHWLAEHTFESRWFERTCLRDHAMPVRDLGVLAGAGDEGEKVRTVGLLARRHGVYRRHRQGDRAAAECSYGGRW